MASQRARFAEGFGQRALLTVDTEEEFDWNATFRADNYGLDHVRALGNFQQFCEGIGVSPVYLVDWPIATDPLARDIIGDAVRRGTAEIGVQLHPWVNPPLREEITDKYSFAGNLPQALEAEKYRRLRDAIEEGFGVVPRIYRAGRYGLGPQTAGMLMDTGIAVDSSVRARYDYSSGHGPDYSKHPVSPYWTDADRRLLELPLTTVYWGLLRRQGEQLFPLASKLPLLGGLLSRLSLLERISLTPEGVTLDEALRGIDIAIDDDLPVFVLSFHSPSLAVGHTPYVRTADDLDDLYDWLRGVYSYLNMRGIEPTTVAEIVDAVQV
ncbi:polysaccharide deacetylase family protein [Qipengyuania qiaonensis]|uniref:Polysaccharide deacetylase family protein n=1 Tax=Qipengyuania qiaonensis TaxID=2867240 RepID=A0ABS7JAF1_9SPHN|nr:polysaccharide deacetylase family protein [Qipengyuania qiaonensis]MBX7483019.1 polysaccharide deacetylase family protein [Qipengyuania qiaonensis]